MKMCQEFKALPERGGYLDQPADVMVRWHDYIVIEGEALEMRRRIEEAQAKARTN
jgi:hypothetical protein